MGRKGESKNISDVKLSTSSTLINCPYLFRQECTSVPKSAKAARNWARVSSWLFEAECARCSLVLPSSEIPDLLSSARTSPTSARGLSACRESIAVYLKLGERGRVTSNHRERNVSGAIGFQNKSSTWCWSWINVDGLEQIGTTLKQSCDTEHLMTYVHPIQVKICSVLCCFQAHRCLLFDIEAGEFPLHSDLNLSDLTKQLIIKRQIWTGRAGQGAWFMMTHVEISS